jgi:hypothetical protein
VSTSLQLLHCLRWHVGKIAVYCFNCRCRAAGSCEKTVAKDCEKRPCWGWARGPDGRGRTAAPHGGSPCSQGTYPPLTASWAEIEETVQISLLARGAECSVLSGSVICIGRVRSEGRNVAGCTGGVASSSRNSEAPDGHTRRRCVVALPLLYVSCVSSACATGPPGRPTCCVVVCGHPTNPSYLLGMLCHHVPCVSALLSDCDCVCQSGQLCSRLPPCLEHDTKMSEFDVGREVGLGSDSSGSGARIAAWVWGFLDGVVTGCLFYIQQG